VHVGPARDVGDGQDAAARGTGGDHARGVHVRAAAQVIDGGIQIGERAIRAGERN